MRRLYRSRNNRMIAGVCGGIAEYLDVDPVFVRLIAVVMLFLGGGSLIAYILGVIIIPNRPVDIVMDPASLVASPPAPPDRTEQNGHAGGLIIGVVMILLGAIFLLRTLPFFHYWWFWDVFSWNFFWPSVLIIVGILIIVGAMRNHQGLRS
jgi:phage shock protein C